MNLIAGRRNWVAEYRANRISVIKFIGFRKEMQNQMRISWFNFLLGEVWKTSVNAYFNFKRCSRPVNHVAL